MSKPSYSSKIPGSLNRFQKMPRMEPTGPKILNLTLYAKAFEVMYTGEKREEFREAGGKIEKQVLSGEYDEVKFVNGYGHHRPWFTCDFYGYAQLAEDQTRLYSNGLTLTLPAGTLVLLLGPVKESGNLELLNRTTLGLRTRLRHTAIGHATRYINTPWGKAAERAIDDVL